MKNIKTIVVFFTVILLAQSCGQKGPLVMPEKKYVHPEDLLEKHSDE